MNCIKMTHILLILAAMTILAFSSSKLDALLPQIEAVLEQGKKNIWLEIEPDEPLWNFPPWLGTLFLSEYYFELKALSINDSTPFKSKFNEEFFTQKLLNSQLPDGSWKQLVDQNQKEGSLDATIFNYWYLKDVGLDVMDAPLKNARKFILDHGGIEKAQMMTKYKLATFGQYQWHLVNRIPLFLFKNAFPFYSYGYIKDYIAQWVYPHLIGLAYLRYQKTVFPVSSVCISELMTSRGHPPCQSTDQTTLFNHFNRLNGSDLLPRDPDVDNMLQQAIKINGRRGAFGAYTISTLLVLLSFKDYHLRYNDTNNEYVTFFLKNADKSLTFVQDMYFNRRVPYEGSLDDGRYWDTILAVFALLEAGESPEKLHPTIKYLIQTAVQSNGGIPYGHQFQYAPDIDDTGMLMMLYGKLKKFYKGTDLWSYYQKEINRTYAWLKSNQNPDGGFPAFDNNKNDGQYQLLTFVFWVTQIDKSAEIFDPSCPDIVGHLFQGMGEADIYDPEVLERGLQYLYKSRKDGMWSARWGINYVYAVGAVFPGLARVGYDMSQEWIANVTKRVISVQQPDGGFGEDQDSYNRGKYLQGVTTASMTAWGLLSYLEVAHTMDLDQHMEKAAKYLIQNFKENGNKFFDRSVVGTGHRGLLNLQYPVYAYSFPLVALARLKSYILKGSSPIVNKDLMERTKKMTQNENSEL